MMHSSVLQEITFHMKQHEAIKLIPSGQVHSDFKNQLKYYNINSFGRESEISHLIFCYCNFKRKILSHPYHSQAKATHESGWLQERELTR